MVTVLRHEAFTWQRRDTFITRTEFNGALEILIMTFVPPTLSFRLCFRSVTRYSATRAPPVGQPAVRL